MFSGCSSVVNAPEFPSLMEDAAAGLRLMGEQQRLGWPRRAVCRSLGHHSQRSALRSALPEANKLHNIEIAEDRHSGWDRSD